MQSPGPAPRAWHNTLHNLVQGTLTLQNRGTTATQATHRNTPDGRAPRKARAQRRARGIIHPKVQQEASHSCNDEERRYRKALQVEGRHAVDGAEGQAQRVQGGDEGAKVGGCECEAQRCQGNHQDPAGSWRQLACGAGGHSNDV